jgi:two-component system phosphate regulon sensor histidine kinase PhoR
MKKNILIAFSLMLFCVLGIAGLQLQYAIHSYKAESAAFKRNTNESLREAVDATKEVRHREVLKKLKRWLDDPAFLTISCKWDAKHEATLFTITQVVPTPGEQNSTSMSIDYFTERVDTIDDKSRNFFISYMADYVDRELREGSGWYYTKQLGDSINKAAWEVPLRIDDIKDQYKASLLKRDINLSFVFNPKRLDNNSYTTGKVNISLNTAPQREIWLSAAFMDINLFLLRQLRWIIVGSLVLVFITMGSFLYMARLLLSQQKLNNIKDDFISNMTHEIHTPLCSISITAEALKKYNHDAAARDSYADIILHQSNRLSALTEEILTGARIDKTGIVLSDDINLGNLIESLIRDYGSGVQLHPEHKGEEITIKGNGKHLIRAIHNLLDNAVKYTNDDNPKVVIKYYRQGNYAIVEIADNGTGIADNDKNKIFEQFYRVPSGNVHSVRGYGLGLSYVKKVIIAHKGSIAVKDNDPSGSVFIITLPL